MNELILVKRAGLKIPTSWKTGVPYVEAQEVEGLLAKKQAELMALREQLNNVQAFLHRCVSGLEGI